MRENLISEYIHATIQYALDPTNETLLNNWIEINSKLDQREFNEAEKRLKYQTLDQLRAIHQTCGVNSAKV